MRKILGAVVSVLLLAVLFAPLAASEPVESGQAVGAGWTVVVDGILRAELVAEAVATIPEPCPADPAPCAESDSAELVGATVGSALDPTVQATVLRSQAAADKAGGIAAALQDKMNAASGVTLTAGDWNVRGYNRVEGLSVLGGLIRADLVEAEAVSGTRLDGAALVNAVAAGANVERLRLAGILGSETLQPIIPGEVNQVLLDVDVPLLGGNVKIVFWETNWDPATASAPAGEPVWVNTLHITAPGVDIIVARAEATSNYIAPPPDNNRPDAVNDSATTTPGTAVLINVTANDTDPENNLDPSSVQVVDGQAPSNGTVQCHTTGVDIGKCTYTPDAGFTGQDSFTYRICDTQGACNTATVTITVAAAAPGNTPPAPDDDAASTPEGTPVDIEVLVGDTDADGIADLRPDSVRVVTAPAHGSASCNDAGVCTYSPSAGHTGPDSFTYEVCDQAWACSTATVTVTVTAVNQPPNAVNDDVDTDPGVAVDVDVVANDQDGNEDDLDPTSLELVAGQGPQSGDATCYDSGPNVGTCTYDPEPGFVGQDSFMYRICDSAGLCDTALVTITVAPPPPPGNRAPDAVDDPTSTPRNTPLTIDVMINDSDPDTGDSLRPGSVRVVTDAQNGTAVCDNGSCTYTPNAGFVGTDTFAYEVCDQAWVCSTATVTITVIGPPAPPVNQAPTAADDTASTTSGSPIVIQPTDNDTDPENDLDQSTLRIIDPPSNGDVECANGSCTYTPNDGFTGTDELTYEICDGAGRCDTATVVIVVQPPTPGSTPPVAGNDRVSTRRGTAVPITVTQNDSDPDGDLDTSSVRVVTQPEHGSVVCVGSLCTYTPDPGFSGNDSFIYEVCDALGACDTAVVTIAVGEPNNNTDGGGSGAGPGAGGGNRPRDGSGPGRPDRDRSPSSPGDSSSGGSPNITPLGAPDLDPVLGGPGTGLPFTGLSSEHYLGLAINLLVVGGLLLLLAKRVAEAPATALATTERREASAPMHLIATPKELQTRPVLPQFEVPAVDDVSPSTVSDHDAAASAEKPATKKAAATKKAIAEKKTATNRTPSKNSSTSKSAPTKTAAKKSPAKKSTAARKITAAKKSTAAKKTGGGAKTPATTARAAKTTSTNTSSAGKKSSVKKSTVARSTADKKPARVATKGTAAAKKN